MSIDSPNVSPTISVSNIPVSFTPQLLATMFSLSGSISSCKLINNYNANKNLPLTAIITYATLSSAIKAEKQFNGFWLRGTTFTEKLIVCFVPDIEDYEIDVLQQLMSLNDGIEKKKNNSEINNDSSNNSRRSSNKDCFSVGSVLQMFINNAIPSIPLKQIKQILSTFGDLQFFTTSELLEIPPLEEIEKSLPLSNNIVDDVNRIDEDEDLKEGGTNPEIEQKTLISLNSELIIYFSFLNTNDNIKLLQNLNNIPDPFFNIILPIFPLISTSNPMSLDPAHPHLESFKYQDTNLYIRNLHESISDFSLSRIFGEFGKIVSAKVITDDKTKNSKSCQYGFVCFETHQEAEVAQLKMNDTILYGLQLHVSFARRRDRNKKYHSKVSSSNSKINLNTSGKSPLNGTNPLSPVSLPMSSPYRRQQPDYSHSMGIPYYYTLQPVPLQLAPQQTYPIYQWPMNYNPVPYNNKPIHMSRNLSRSDSKSQNNQEIGNPEDNNNDGSGRSKVYVNNVNNPYNFNYPSFFPQTYYNGIQSHNMPIYPINVNMMPLNNEPSQLQVYENYKIDGKSGSKKQTSSSVKDIKNNVH